MTVYLYRVFWPNGLSVTVTANKYLTQTELEFLVHCQLVDTYGGEPHDQKSDAFVRVDVALPR